MEGKAWNLPNNEGFFFFLFCKIEKWDIQTRRKYTKWDSVPMAFSLPTPSTLPLQFEFRDHII